MLLFNLPNVQFNGVEESVNKLGGKGYGLLIATKYSMPCPETWVVSADLFREFVRVLSGGFKCEDLLLMATDFITKRLSDELSKLPHDLYAVRSSATIEDSKNQSFAGMFESMLNIANNGLAKAIAEVWLSGLSTRVQEYAMNSNWASMAVVIQPMIASRFSGVCFSAHPSPSNLRESENYLIEIVQGLGNKLVQGEVTPITLTGTFGALTSCTSYPWLTELLLVVSRLKELSGNHVDVEFAVDIHEDLWILQQRPVTELTENVILDLTGYKKQYKRAMCTLDIELLIDGCTRHLAPYLEVNVDLSGWMVMVTNERDGQQELWLNKLLEEAVVSQVRQNINIDQQYLTRLETRYKYYHRQILNWESMDWADKSLSHADRLYSFFEFVQPLAAHYYAPMHIIEGLSSLILDKMKIIDPNSAEDDFFYGSTLKVSTLGQILSTECIALKREIVNQLCLLPEDHSQLTKHLSNRLIKLTEKYGFLNCHQPFEQPYGLKEIYEMVRYSTDGPGQYLDKGQGNSVLAEKYSSCRGMFNQLSRWLNIRNQEMEYLYYAYSKARYLLLDVGKALGLNLQQIWNSDRTYLLDSLNCMDISVRVNKDRRLSILHNGKKAVLQDDLTILFPTMNGSEDGLKGRTAFGSGQLTGIVKIAFSLEDIEKIKEPNENIIVVTGMTTPDFVPLLKKKAAGLVTDEGGILCHAAIIAREIKLPCIVGAGMATELFRDGVRVSLDLDRGEVQAI